MAKAYQIAAPLLMPLLLAQGLYVRRVTPRLPEPTGPRAGTLGAGVPLRLLILGDSAAAGVGALSQAAALSGRLTALLALHYRLSFQLVAQSGLTLQGLLKIMESTPPARCDMALVSIGVNDAVHGTPLKSWRTLLSKLGRRLRSGCGVRHILLTSLPPMHAFPALPQPLRWFMGQRAAALNRELRRFTAQNRDCEYLEPGFPLEKNFSAADGFHPSEHAYALWAKQAAAAIRRAAPSLLGA